ncbi:MAG: class I tRNA ligase family protein [Akkermansia sp.]|nr:class I tRNA ligase family protein [Akkermansia sp.]
MLDDLVKISVTRALTLFFAGDGRPGDDPRTVLQCDGVHIAASLPGEEGVHHAHRHRNADAPHQHRSGDGEQLCAKAKYQALPAELHGRGNHGVGKAADGHKGARAAKFGDPVKHAHACQHGGDEHDHHAGEGGGSGDGHVQIAQAHIQENLTQCADAAAGDIYVGVEPPADPENWVQDEDALDTWFSSWLWPFATMDDECRAKFYPTSDLVTGPDIIFFWVARMIMAGYRFADGKPFSNVFFTSIVRDLQGRKMSKSLGNSPDPLDLIAHYGADGLRFGLMRIAPTGTDVKFDEKQIEEGKNFANKLYNAARFRMMQGEAGTEAPKFAPVHIDILSKLKELHITVADALGKYEFNTYTQALYSYFWNEYCSLFLEAVKNDLREGEPAVKNATLYTIDTVLRHYLALLSPIMPHITEELWQSLGFAARNEGKPLMSTPLPSADSLLAGLSDTDISKARALSTALYDTANRARNLKAEYNLATNKKVRFVVKPSLPVNGDLMSRLALLAGAQSATAEPDYEAPKGTPTALTPFGELFLPLDGLVDVEAERNRISKELEKITKEIAKSNAKLSNASFVDRAPAAVVDQERARLAEWESKKAQLESMLAALS